MNKMLKSAAIITGIITSFYLIWLEQVEVLVSGKPITGFFSVISYSILGSMILFIAYRFVDWLVPVDIEAEIFENKNQAAAIFKGLFMLAVAVIIAAVIVS